MGFATNRGEWRESVWGLAAPVKQANGNALAAVGVSGPEYRISGDTRFSELAFLVRQAAADIQARLYGVSGPARR